MKRVFINGKFLCQRITGVQRYAIEIVKELDKLSNCDMEFQIIAPDSQYFVTNLKLNNITIKAISGKPNYYWEQWILPRFCKKNNCDELLNLCNVAPILYPGICTLHDMAFIEAKNGYNKKQIFVYKLLTRLNIRRYKTIFTVSNVMRESIMRYYKVDNVKVTYNGYEHLTNIIPTKPNINVPNKYYLSLGSLNPNKNFKAILKLAENHINEHFLIVGGQNNFFKKEKITIPQNVIFTGYLKDSEISYLYKNCIAFLFPSVYEGFGIPPLEAIINGCTRIICKNIDVLKELYDGYVTFWDFADPHISLADFPELKKNLTLLKSKFNWQNSAKIIYDSILEQVK